MIDKCPSEYRTAQGATLTCEREMGHKGSHLQRDTDWFGVWSDAGVQIYSFEPKQPDADQSQQ